MQVSVEESNGLERVLRLGIPADQIDGEVQKRIADTAKRARIDGFRPGKVPRKVIKQRFGDAIRSEVIGEIANKSFQDAITQESLKPVGQPAMDILKNEEGHDLELTAKFEVFPEIKLGDASELQLEKSVGEVTDGDVETMIEKLRSQRADWNEVDRAAADGDKVNIDFVGYRDGEKFEGGSAEGHDLELGSGQMIPGFESGLVGVAKGESRTLELTFPEDYHSKELAAAEVSFEVTANEIKEKTLPELDDAFFKLFDVEGDLDAFKANVRENMEKQLDDALAEKLKTSVLDALLEQNPVELPDALIQQEIQQLRQQSLSRMGITPENAENFDASLLPDEMFDEQARRRVACGVIINQFVEDHEVRPEREQLLGFIDDIAGSYENPEEVRNMYLGNEDYLRQVSLIVTEKLVVEKIESMASVTETSIGYEEAMQSYPAQ